MSHRFCVAPMMGCTDLHFRQLMRSMTRRAVLYTEMITTWALLNGDARQLLRHAANEHPLALQLGGCDPAALAQCVQLACEAGYDEVNLNCGCPSERVAAGRFGACLMLEPDQVARCVESMLRAADGRTLISVKCRIGVDAQDPRETFVPFVDRITSAGCTRWIVHARKAWLQGLSPKQNRHVPPIQHDIALELKQRRPGLHVVLNGEIRTLAQCQQLLVQGVDGVMLGREVYRNPCLLAEVDQLLYDDHERAAAGPWEVAAQYLAHLQRELQANPAIRLIPLVRHMHGLFAGRPGAAEWRRQIAESAREPPARMLERMRRAADTMRAGRVGRETAAEGPVPEP